MLVQKMKAKIVAVLLVTASMGTWGATTGEVLAHRWSFNGSAADAVGGRAATFVGDAGCAPDGRTAVLKGGKWGAGYIDLGTGLLPAAGEPLTLEVWATLDTACNWPRVFDWGSGKLRSLFQCWNNAGQGKGARLEVTDGQVDFRDDQAPACANDRQARYFALVLTPTTDGSTQIKWMRSLAATGAVEAQGEDFVPGWMPANLNAAQKPANLQLGHSRWDGEADAAARYDEVRIWKAALTGDQLAANAKAGPDALPAAVATAPSPYTRTVKPIPVELFGQNLEHTRATFQDGISAQLVHNRKFTGKSSRRGVSMQWESYGTKAFYTILDFGCTRHAARSAMFRQNEIHSQLVGGLDPNGEAGVRQRGLGLRGGVAHTFRAVVGTYHPEDTTFVLRLAANGQTLAEKTFTVNLPKHGAWTRIAFDYTAPTNTMADIEIGVKGRAYGILGAVSLMPADNFHGLRADVVENLREIGTSIVRWPGGNFAGEYRWRDGLIADPDERAPIQSYMEIETQPHSLGYDANDVGMEEVLAMCEKIGAQPFFTINPAWDSPADSADWVRRCKGRVKLWSLGNEMGFAHMEGPKGPEAYAQVVRPHAEAMKKVDPSITICSSGPYPSTAWIRGSGMPLADLAPVVSYHRYDHAGSWGTGSYDYTTPKRIQKMFLDARRAVDGSVARLRNFRAKLPRSIGISYDEWNLWYQWYREEAIVEGLYAAYFLTEMMRNWEACGLAYLCYFQPVNEQAICVGPFESHLTSLGEAMRLMKGHVGGTPVFVRGLAREAFVTDAPDGTRYVTAHNFSISEPKTIRVPLAGRTRIACGETLVPNGLVCGCRYQRRPGAGELRNGELVLVVPPAGQAAVRLAR